MSFLRLSEEALDVEFKQAEAEYKEKAVKQHKKETAQDGLLYGLFRAVTQSEAKYWPPLQELISCTGALQV